MLGCSGSKSPFVAKISVDVALGKTAVCTIPFGKWVGTSFMLCTAISTVPFSIATSRVLVKIPVIVSILESSTVYWVRSSESWLR